MNSDNYLEKKYPNQGYKTPVSAPNHFLKFGYKPTIEEKENEIKYKNTKKLPCTNVCECGHEWESKFTEYQEGCYPYVAKNCRDCNFEHEKKRLEFEKKEATKKILTKFDNSLPPRYRGKIKSPKNKILLNSTCSIIWGEFGTGKTWEAYAVGKELICTDQIKTFKLITEVDILNDLKDGFDSMQSKIKHYKDLDLLVIDESGKNNDSDFNKSQLFGILNYRYDWMKKTILICNAKDKKEVMNLLPTATIDRFRECVIEMKGKSLRYKES